MHRFGPLSIRSRCRLVDTPTLNCSRGAATNSARNFHVFLQPHPSTFFRSVLQLSSRPPLLPPPPRQQQPQASKHQPATVNGGRPGHPRHRRRPRNARNHGAPSPPAPPPPGPRLPGAVDPRQGRCRALPGPWRRWGEGAPWWGRIACRSFPERAARVLSGGSDFGRGWGQGGGGAGVPGGHVDECRGHRG